MDPINLIHVDSINLIHDFHTQYKFFTVTQDQFLKIPLSFQYDILIMKLLYQKIVKFNSLFDLLSLLNDVYYFFRIKYPYYLRILNNLKYFYL